MMKKERPKDENKTRMNSEKKTKGRALGEIPLPLGLK